MGLGYYQLPAQLPVLFSWFLLLNGAISHFSPQLVSSKVRNFGSQKLTVIYGPLIIITPFFSLVSFFYDIDRNLALKSLLNKPMYK